MALLSREAILGVEDIPTQDVEVPEWGGTVRVKGLNGKERDQYEASVVGDTAAKKGQARRLNMANMRARFVSLCIVDEEGVRLFSDGDVTALGAKSAAALQRVFKVAQELSGLTDEDVEELAGNSEAGQSGSSTSA
jgi:hypothetical protein